MQWVLALDPGSTETGWVLLAAPPPKAPRAAGKKPNGAMLADLDGQIRLASELPLLVLESIPAVYGRSALPELCEGIRWEGRFIQAWYAGTGALPTLVARSTVKAWLCGTGKANDRDVRAELLHRWGLPSDIKPKALKSSPLAGFAADMWAALAVALWAQNHPGIAVPGEERKEGLTTHG